MGDDVQSIVDAYDGRRVTKGAQTVVSVVNNSTQTESNSVEQLLENLMEGIDQLESNIQEKYESVNVKLESLREGNSISVSSAVLGANACLNDPYSIDNIDVRTPTRVVTTPTSRRTPLHHVPLTMQQKRNEPSFWNLTPNGILGKDEGTITDAAKARSMFYKPQLTCEII